MKRPAFEERLDELLPIKLAEGGRTAVWNLSGGMKRRTSIAALFFGLAVMTVEDRIPA